VRMKVAVEFRRPIDRSDDLVQRMLRTPTYPCPLIRSRSVTSASGNRESARVMISDTSLSGLVRISASHSSLRF
jgi:hypothetical protein